MRKEINLKIAGRLKEYLEAAGFSVTMTRTTDDGLYSDSDAKKKAADMKAATAFGILYAVPGNSMLSAI